MRKLALLVVFVVGCKNRDELIQQRLGNISEQDFKRSVDLEKKLVDCARAAGMEPGGRISPASK